MDGWSHVCCTSIAVPERSGMPLDSLKSPKELAKDKPHGVRMKYLGGCRCLPCRGAYSQYETDRQREIKESGRKTGYVSADEAREHLIMLSKNGVGRRSVHHASGVADSILHEIKLGRRKRIFAKTEHRILQVDDTAKGAAGIVPAGPTWTLINELLEEGFTKSYLAERLGRKVPALQIHKERVTVKTAVTIERLYGDIMRNGRSEGPEARQIRKDYHDRR